MTTPARTAFEVWLAQADDAARSQPPADELLGEHHVMQAVVAAMEAEAQRMLTGGALRPGFWSDVVDFNGNFVHLCHRAKEEEHLVPALTAHGLIDDRFEKAIRKEHESGKNLTLELAAGVGDDDWEKVMRLVSIYAHILRPHMRHEEDRLFAAAPKLPPDAVEALRAEFDAVERRAFCDRDRRAIVTLARRIAETAGVEHDLSAA